MFAELNRSIMPTSSPPTAASVAVSPPEAAVGDSSAQRKMQKNQRRQRAERLPQRHQVNCLLFCNLESRILRKAMSRYRQQGAMAAHDRGKIACLLCPPQSLLQILTVRTPCRWGE